MNTYARRQSGGKWSVKYGATDRLGADFRSTIEK